MGTVATREHVQLIEKRVKTINMRDFSLKEPDISHNTRATLLQNAIDSAFEALRRLFLILDAPLCKCRPGIKFGYIGL